MAESKVARRYAQALLELCDESNNHPVIGKQLDGFVEAWNESTDLQIMLRNPVVDVDTKKRVVEAAFRKALWAPVTKNFINVLLDHERITTVEEVTEQFKQMLASRDEALTATVRSAAPLRRADLDKIQASLARTTSKQVNIETTVDPALIGGVVAQIGNILLDGSVRTDLNLLREQLVGG